MVAGPVSAIRRPGAVQPRCVRQPRLRGRRRPLRPACLSLRFLKVRGPPEEAPTRLQGVAARPAQETTRPVARAKLQAQPTTAPQGPQALRSWARPRKMGPRARSTKAPAGSQAERWSWACPSPSQQDQAVRRPAAQRPRKELAARPRVGLPRSEAIPTSEQVATARQPGPEAAAQVPVQEAGLALEAPRVEARPTPEQEGQRSRPSWALPVAELAAQALREVRQAAGPTSGRPAASVQAAPPPEGAHPRSDQKLEGPDFQAPRVVRPRPVVVQRAATPTASPRLPGLTWQVRKPAGPSWAMHRRGVPR